MISTNLKKFKAQIYLFQEEMEQKIPNPHSKIPIAKKYKDHNIYIYILCQHNGFLIKKTWQGQFTLGRKTYFKKHHKI